MRAFAVRSFGEPASVQDLPVPTAHAEVLIRVLFAGVNPLDNNLLGRLTAASPYPFVVGIDFAGVAEQVPAGVHGLQAGDRVFGMAGRTVPMPSTPRSTRGRDGAVGPYP